MTRWVILYALSLSLAFGLVSWACYATSGPVVGPNPADYPPLNDDRTVFAVRKDAGR